MTQHIEPVRWTATPGEAPDVLRDAFVAGREEGPSGAQMRALSLKLAAVAAGAGVAGAAQAGGGAYAATAVKATFGGLKLIGAITVAGAMAVSAIVFYRQPPASRQGTKGSSIVGAGMEANREANGVGVPGIPAAGQADTNAGAPPAMPVPSVLSMPAPTTHPLETSPSQPVSTVGPDHRSGARREMAESTRSGRQAVRSGPAQGQRRANAQSVVAPPAVGSAAVSTDTSRPATSELGLLRRAQATLATRPREAFALTQQHRSLYPQGQFSEERDALAVQALMRAGELDEARDFATRFVRLHPGSAHAHRFREMFKLP